MHSPHSLTHLSDFAHAMGQAKSGIEALLKDEAQRLAVLYRGFKAGRGGFSCDCPIFQVDFLVFPALMQPMVAHGLNAVRECSCCGELFMLSASGQKGSELCCWCKREKAALNLRRWREENKQVVTPRACVVCGTQFTPKRSDAKTCSAKCRTNLSRQKKKA